VIVIADTIALYAREAYEQGLRIVTAATQRVHPAALSPRVKSLNYLNNIMAKLEGLQAGCVEALMLNHKGEVAECTADNVFVVRGRRLLTPPPDAGILEGITRGAVMELAEAAGIDCREATLTRHDLYTADECFLTGTAAEVLPVVEIDGRKVGPGTPGPMTTRLIADFHRLVRG
jgi:branched-chain amino acid aminotransferase